MKKIKRRQENKMEKNHQKITNLWILFWIAIAFITLLAVFVYAIPLVDFINPTPANNIWTTNTSIIVNTSINEANLASLIYNWNGTNYTMYDNSSLVLMMNFENFSSLEELSYIV